MTRERNPSPAPVTRPARAATLDFGIDELVLHGFDARDRRGIADSLQRELARLVAERAGGAGSWPAAAIERIDAGAVTLRPGATAREIGAEIAGAVLRALTGGAA